MSPRSDKHNNIKKSAQTNNFSLLHLAETALAVGAIFGFLAVLTLVLLSWSLALIATAIAMAALVVAVVILSIPPNPIVSVKTKPEGEPPNVPKDEGVVVISCDFIHSTRHILESTVSSKEAASTLKETGHFSSPLGLKDVDTQEVIEMSQRPSIVP